MLMNNNEYIEIIETIKEHINIYKDEIKLLYSLPEDTEEEKIIKNYKIQQMNNKLKKIPMIFRIIPRSWLDMINFTRTSRQAA